MLAAAILGGLYDRGRKIAIFDSNTPGDTKYWEDLVESVIGVILALVVESRLWRKPTSSMSPYGSTRFSRRR